MWGRGVGAPRWGPHQPTHCSSPKRRPLPFHSHSQQRKSACVVAAAGAFASQSVHCRVRSAGDALPAWNWAGLITTNEETSMQMGRERNSPSSLHLRAQEETTGPRRKYCVLGPLQGAFLSSHPIPQSRAALLRSGSPGASLSLTPSPVSTWTSSQAHWARCAVRELGAWRGWEPPCPLVTGFQATPSPLLPNPIV